MRGDKELQQVKVYATYVVVVLIRAFLFYSKECDSNLSNRLPDETVIDEVDNSKVYAVFISYCEIYNKYIYDLLEDTRDCIGGKPKYVGRQLRQFDERPF